jgi:uncharacterized protein YukE
MDLRVNQTEMNGVCDYSNVQSEQFQENVNFWLTKLDELKEIWQGEDADEFFENATSYIKRLSSIKNCYDSLEDFMMSANRSYRDTDLENSKEFQTDDVYEEGVLNVEDSYQGY